MWRSDLQKDYCHGKWKLEKTGAQPMEATKKHMGPHVHDEDEGPGEFVFSPDQEDVAEEEEVAKNNDEQLPEWNLHPP